MYRGSPRLTASDLTGLEDLPLPSASAATPLPGRVVRSYPVPVRFLSSGQLRCLQGFRDPRRPAPRRVGNPLRCRECCKRRPVPRPGPGSSRSSSTRVRDASPAHRGTTRPRVGGSARRPHGQRLHPPLVALLCPYCGRARVVRMASIKACRASRSARRASVQPASLHVSPCTTASR